MPTSKHDYEVAEWEPKRRLEYERNRLRVLVAARIENLLDGMNLKQSDLAKRIGKSSAWVSKLLSGNQNVTLDTLAEIGWALGVRWDTQACPTVRENTPASADGPLPDWVHRQGKIVVRHVAVSGYSVAPTDPRSDIDAMAYFPAHGSSARQGFFSQHSPGVNAHLLSSVRLTAGDPPDQLRSCVAMWSNVDPSPRTWEFIGFMGGQSGIGTPEPGQIKAASVNMKVIN